MLNTNLKHCSKKVQFSKDIRTTDGAHISKIIIFIKDMLKIPSRETIAMHDKQIKE